MKPIGEPAAVPAVFRRAVAGLTAERDRQVRLRPEVSVEEIPAPQRLAPHAAAVSATVCRDDADLAVGRLILLYDPHGQRGWRGPFRVVAYIRADLEPEIAADPLLGPVGWSWLTEALEAHDAGYTAPSGTITRAVTEGFGDKAGEPATTELELRASWSPVGEDVAAHLAAWCDALCAAAGLPPPAPGVSTLPARPASGGSRGGGRGDVR